MLLLLLLVKVALANPPLLVLFFGFTSLFSFLFYFTVLGAIKLKDLFHFELFNKFVFIFLLKMESLLGFWNCSKCQHQGKNSILFVSFAELMRQLGDYNVPTSGSMIICWFWEMTALLVFILKYLLFLWCFKWGWFKEEWTVETNFKLWAILIVSLNSNAFDYHVICLLFVHKIHEALTIALFLNAVWFDSYPRTGWTCS